MVERKNTKKKVIAKYKIICKNTSLFNNFELQFVCKKTLQCYYCKMI